VACIGVGVLDNRLGHLDQSRMSQYSNPTAFLPAPVEEEESDDNESTSAEVKRRSSLPSSSGSDDARIGDYDEEDGDEEKVGDAVISDFSGSPPLSGEINIKKLQLADYYIRSYK
jgi:hypothetical protein